MKNTHSTSIPSVFAILFTCLLFVLSSCDEAAENQKKSSQTGSSAQSTGQPQLPPVPESALPAAPGEINNLFAKEQCDARAAVIWWMKGLETEDYAGWEPGKTAHYPAYFIAYSVFNLGNKIDRCYVNSANKDYRACIDKGMDRVKAFSCFGQSFREKIIYPVYRSESLRNTAYNWMLPEWKKLFAQMPQERKRLCSQILNHSLNYARNFNYQKELNFLNSLPADKQHLFTAYYPVRNLQEDFNAAMSNPYRKAETWIFRRIHQKHMTQQEVVTWLEKVKQDLGL